MSRKTRSERAAIEAGIYGRLSVQAISKKIGKNPKYVSQEILQNRTLVKGEHPCGNDCRLATGCKRRYSEARSKPQVQGEALEALNRLVTPLIKKG